MIDRHPEDTQTLAAELMALLLAREGERQWSSLSGTFTTKVVSGREYVYFQHSDAGGKKRQFAVGPRTPAVEAIVAAYRDDRGRRESDDVQIERLVRLLRSAGLTTLPHAVARLLRSLADAGVFRLGGVLIGSYAFQLVGNALGVRWPEAAWRTQDVDVAAHVRLAAPNLEADVPSALESLRMGFLPIPQLDPRHASTSFKVRGKPLRLDLLTPGREAEEEPLFIPRFRAAAAPVKYLSLVMEDAQPAAAVDGGATLVMVPAPARLALHKLLVSQTRSLQQQTKSTKDVHQAALLLEVLAEDRPEDLEQTAERFAASGPAVTKKVLRGLTAAEKRWPAPSAAGARIVRQILGS